ncbi:MAG: TrmH family RNA methyltransferase [Planctomycetota bacterium]|nr:TrmH family RNA methyltransferase [Planctomycetota bacterium]
MSLSRAQRQRITAIARGRSEEPLFVLEGRRAVRDALRAGYVAELWLRAGLPADVAAELRADAHAADTPVGEGSAADFDRLPGTVTPQGVLALVRDTSRPLPEVASLPGLLLWLDGLQDPGNVGAVVRVAAAFGAAGLLVSEGGAHPLGLKALRASAGLALRLPFARAEDEAIAAAVGERPVYLLERDGDDVFAVEHVPGDYVLVVGSEGRGPGAAARGVCTRTLGIPIATDVDSLNAAVAAGIAVAALRRIQGPGA